MIDNPGDRVAHQKAHEASTKVQEVVALVARAAEHVKATGEFCFDKAKDALGDRHGDRALAALAGVALHFARSRCIQGQQTHRVIRLGRTRRSQSTDHRSHNGELDLSRASRNGRAILSEGE